MKRDDFHYEEMRDRRIADIANRLYDADVNDLPADDVAGRKWLWNECEVEAIKQVEQIEKQREEQSLEARILNWLWERGRLS